MKKILFAVLALCAFVFAEPRVHDGFYMNLKSGFGYMDLKSDRTDYSYVDLKSAFSENLTFKLGGAVNPHLVIVGALSMSVTSGEVKTSGYSYYGSYQTRKTDAMLLSMVLGPGIVFYPVQGGALDNFFIGATLGLGMCGIDLENAYLSWEEDDRSSSNTASGFGASLEIGKEWWVGDNWSLGVDLVYTYVIGEDIEYSSLKWTSNAIQLRFTITRS